MKLSLEAAAPPTPGLLHPDPGVREGPLPDGGGLSEPARWGAPGAALPGKGGPLEGAQVPGRGGRGTLEVWGGELPVAARMGPGVGQRILGSTL